MWKLAHNDQIWTIALAFLLFEVQLDKLHTNLLSSFGPTGKQREGPAAEERSLEISHIDQVEMKAPKVRGGFQRVVTLAEVRGFSALLGATYTSCKFKAVNSFKPEEKRKSPQGKFNSMVPRLHQRLVVYTRGSKGGRFAVSPIKINPR